MTLPDADNLWHAYAADRSIANRNRLVEYHMPIVEAIARQMYGRMRAAELADLRSAGFIGLIQAVERFDAARGLKFGSFAGHRIRGEIIDFCRREDRVPRATRHRFKTWHEARDLLTAKLNRPPTEQEVEQAIGIKPGAWHDSLLAAEASCSLVSLSMASTDFPGVTLDAASDDPEVGYELAADEEFEHMLAASGLNSREQVTLQMTYRDGRLQKDIAPMIGCVPSVVSNVIRDAHHKIKKTLASAA